MESIDNIGYIYLIKIYPFDENIYKIGKTKDDIKTRLSAYKRYKIILIFPFNKSIVDSIELNIIKLFKSKFKQCNEIGNEYFNGNPFLIRTEAIEYLKNLELEGDNESVNEITTVVNTIRKNQHKGIEFSCSCCAYISSKRSHVIRHINKLNSCGPGIKKVIEHQIEIKCKYCNKNFTTRQNLNEHIKHSCSLKN